MSAAFATGYTRTRCSSAIYIVDLRSLAELLWYPLLSYIRTRCSYAVNIVDLRSCVAEPRWYLLLSYIRTRCSYAINTADLRLHVLQSLAGSTAVLHSHLLRVYRHCCWLPPYTLLVCRLHRRPAFACSASLVPTSVLHSYTLHVCRQHRRPAWIRLAEPRCYARLSYIPTCCVSAAFAAGYIRTCYSSAVYIVDLRWHALQSFVATHCCPTFLHAARMPSTSLTSVHVLQSFVATHCCPTFVRAAHMQSTSLTCVHVLQNLVGACCCPTFVRAACMPSTPLPCIRTRCRASLVPTAVLHSHLLRICRHYHWLHSYALLVCHQHRRPVFACIAERRWCPLLFYIRTCCTSATIIAGYIRTHYSSALYIIDLRSHALQSFVATHGCPTFVRAARMPSTSLTCIRVLQNHVGICCCPTFVHGARRPSTLSTCVRTRCRASLVPTAVLHSHLLRVCHHYRWLHSYALLVCRQHPRPAFLRIG